MAGGGCDVHEGDGGGCGADEAAGGEESEREGWAAEVSDSVRTHTAEATKGAVFKPGTSVAW
ncbi:uncharacterized protein CMC5_018620 [Chondromyces crocatus]|uniref:Uncharacterized protein n=1 Tax=Chondromyces crocatus TaxID=52 RepID=A0A0K1EA30_CHOCO|nr:uncharacterized protein CMC5_018620 [Chondromyces crocatus]